MSDFIVQNITQQGSMKLSVLEQILLNRGIKEEDLCDYISAEEYVAESPILLGKAELDAAVNKLNHAIHNMIHTYIIVDCDCDGFTASALMTNFLYYYADKEWYDNCVHFFFHEGKVHGLKDYVAYLSDLDLIKQEILTICPDGGSNDFEEQRFLSEIGGTIILDHHIVDDFEKVENTIVLNNQLSNYPNKFMSGVGIVWQFCRYINDSIANKFLDLVALGLIGDMMSLKSLETKALVQQGLQQWRIENPFIKGMLEKQAFSLSKSDYKSYNGNACSPMGAAFFIVPFINAVNRSGDADEKELLFNSMLDSKAYNEVPSTKRGHLIGENETIVTQSVRVVTNVKNRQTKQETEAMERLESRIRNEDLLNNHRVLLIPIEEDEVRSELRGLVANKLMAKYQRPCVIATDIGDSISGSMRGYTGGGIDNFKQVCQDTGCCDYVIGHENAAGISINKENIDTFLSATDEIIKNTSNKPIYKVDYEFPMGGVRADIITELAKLNDYWGQDINRPYVSVDFFLSKDNVYFMKSNTIKVMISNEVSLIKFGCSDEEYLEWQERAEHFTEAKAICKCGLNEWGGTVTPQLIPVAVDFSSPIQYIF